MNDRQMNFYLDTAVPFIELEIRTALAGMVPPSIDEMLLGFSLNSSSEWKKTCGIVIDRSFPELTARWQRLCLLG